MTETNRTLEANDVVEATLQCFVEGDGEGPGGVCVGFYDAYGNRHIVVLKRKWIRERTECFAEKHNADSRAAEIVRLKDALRYIRQFAENSFFGRWRFEIAAIVDKALRQ